MGESCIRAGRSCDSVRLVAVSKTHGPDMVREAYDEGLRVFGENYAREAASKADALADLPGIEWHFIGHLQRNKVRLVVERTTVIESVDSEPLVLEISRKASALGKSVDILVEVNVGREPQKGGVDPDRAGDLVALALETPSIRCRGLMVVPPFDLEPGEARPWFSGLRELRDRLGGPAVLPDLSMGMSADYIVAIEEGSTIVRIGTAIFGPRLT